MKEFNFTKASILGLPQNPVTTTSYRDTKEKGLSLYVTPNGVMTFFIRKRINGKDERIVIGNFPEISVECARKKALSIKSLVAEGLNPNQKKQELKKEIIFKELFDLYMERYSKKEKRSWEKDEREINRFLSHWFKRKISSITKQEIQTLHEKIRDENGLYQANRLLERIRAIYNKAIEWGWNGVNPTLGIKKFKEQSRSRFLYPEEASRFLEAVESDYNETVRDYILISLFTGARKSNVLSMRWCDINWHAEEWRIPLTKNGEPHSVHLVDEALEILKARKQSATSEWVFPSETSKSGHLIDPKKAWKRILNKAGIEDFRLHDIRRTFGSYQAMAGASLLIIGKTLGHKSQTATQVYAHVHKDPVKNFTNQAVKLMRNGKKD